MNKLTEEQMKVVTDEAPIKRVDSVPGAGKTTVLLEVVKYAKEKQHLLLCFNASIKDEIKEKVKREGITNVDVYTFHGFAYSFFRGGGRNLITDFPKRRMTDEYDYFFLKKKLKEYGKRDFTTSEINGFKCAFESFLISNLTLKEYFKDNKDYFLYRNFFLEIQSNPKIPLTHGFYIKLFQMIKFKTKTYESVLVDECQDMSPCYFSIVKNLQSPKEMYVGDSFQKIYGYNGAIGFNDEMGKLLPMSISFRVGYDIAYFCNSLIWSFFNLKKFQMKGSNRGQKIVEKLPEGEMYAIITRTNLGLLKRLYKEASEGKYCYVIGGKETLGLDQIKSIFLATPQKPYFYLGKIPLENLDEVKKIQKITEDETLKKIISFIDLFKEKTLEVLVTIESMLVFEQNLANVILTTTHKSKGLEFKNVEIGEDFKDVYKLHKKKLDGEDVSDEIYILYVAISRSCNHIKLNDNLMRWYRQAKDYKRKEKKAG